MSAKIHRKYQSVLRATLIVGIDIDRASQILNLSELEISSIPSKKFIFSPSV